MQENNSRSIADAETDANESAGSKPPAIFVAPNKTCDSDGREITRANPPNSDVRELAAEIRKCGLLLCGTDRYLSDEELAVVSSALASNPPQPQAGTVRIDHDGFEGNIIGNYTTREGKRGVVIQQLGTRVVHVYGEKWLTAAAPQPGAQAVAWPKVRISQKDFATQSDDWLRGFEAGVQAAENALNNLPMITKEQGMAMRTGQPTPNASPTITE